MGFETQHSKESEQRAFEIASKLDGAVLDVDLNTLEKAVRYMGANTRETLARAIAVAGMKAGDKPEGTIVT